MSWKIKATHQALLEGRRHAVVVHCRLSRQCRALLDSSNPGNSLLFFVAVPVVDVAFVEELPGANTQSATMEEARENLREALELSLEANGHAAW